VTREIIIWAFASLAFLLIPVACLFGFVLRRALRERQWSRGDVLALGACAILLAALFLRPHEHVFQALDSSAFRHMASSFLEGRGFHDVDEALVLLPPEARPWVLQDHNELFRGNRITRDRSFQIEFMDAGVTRPFFYPLLPLSMAGWDLLIPGDAMDYLMPCLFLSLVLSVLVFAGKGAGWRGILLATGLWIASPLPAWLGRGCYLETVSAVLLGLAVLSWFTARKPGGVSIFAFWALGLSVTYHPVMLLLALPVGAGRETGKRREPAPAGMIRFGGRLACHPATGG